MSTQIVLVAQPTSETRHFGEYLKQKSDYDVINVDIAKLSISSLKFHESNCVLIDGSQCDFDEFICVLNQGRLLQSASKKIFCVLFNVPKQFEVQLLERYEGWYLFKGLFPVDCPNNMIIKGLDKMFAGDYWLPRSFMNKYLENINPLQECSPSTLEDIHRTLTPKEIEILDSICNGMSNSEVADSMFISLHTVKAHIYNIYRKLNVKNRMQAANRYSEW